MFIKQVGQVCTDILGAHPINAVRLIFLIEILDEGTMKDGKKNVAVGGENGKKKFYRE
jgi:hypothetical protein